MADSSKMEDPGSVLAIDTSPFGSSLALIPAIRALRAEYPNTLLVVAASPGICELLSAAPLVNDTIELKAIKSPDPGYFDSLQRLASLIKGTRRYNFDLVLDFSPRLETQIASRVIIRSRTITPSRPSRVIELLIGWAGARFVRQSGSSKYDNVLRQAGVDLDDTSLRVEVPEQEHARFEQRLVKAGSRGGELLALLHSSNPNDTLSWPVGSFAELSGRLSSSFGARIIAVDEPSDRTFTDALTPLLPAGAIRLVEPSAFEFVAAIARASLVITDQTMVARIASEMGTPAIEIADTIASQVASTAEHRVLEGPSRTRVTPDEAYEAACEMIHKSRSPGLFQRR